MNRLDNTLRLIVNLAVYKESVKCIKLTCDRLTWVSDPEPSAASPLMEIVRSDLLLVLNKEGGSLDALNKAITKTREAIQRHLSENCSIHSSIHLHVVVEEESEGAFNALSQRLKSKREPANLGKFASGLAHASIDFQWIEQTARNNAGTVSQDNFGLVTPEVFIHPGRSIDLEITSGVAVHCRQMRIYSGTTLLIRDAQPLTLGAESPTRVRLPGISVRQYGMLIGQNAKELRIELMMDGSKSPITVPKALPYTGLVLKQPPVSVFLDIGSSMSKIFFVIHKTAPDDTSLSKKTIAKELSEQLKSALSGSTEHVKVEPPQATSAFAETYGIPRIAKRALDQVSDNELGAYFANAITRLAERFYARENRLLADVYWSFPNTKSRNFEAISHEINERLNGVILGTVRLNAEAECLREAFSKVLHTLSQSALGSEKEVISAQEKNERSKQARSAAKAEWDAYKEKPLLARLWKTVTFQRPQDPTDLNFHKVDVPNLEPWQEDFLKLVCNETLSEFLVFDAGGYSLDVLGVFSNKNHAGISESFEAGSFRITEVLAGRLKDKNPGSAWDECIEHAENSKIEICEDPSAHEKHPFYKDCRKATETIYGQAVARILDKVAAQPSLRGFPVILTGGGSRNLFLHDLMSRELKQRNLDTIAVHSILLYSTLKRSVRSTTSEVQLFLAMASAFHPEEETPRMGSSTDILSGMSQIALKQ
jgi:hypothetical protein